jgi:hypothetical protein
MISMLTALMKQAATALALPEPRRDSAFFAPEAAV